MDLCSTTRISTREVCALAGLHPTTLTRWVEDGTIRPALGGGRRGAAREWTVAQAFAIVVGAAYRSEGASPGRVAGVIRFLAGVRPRVLEADIAAGRTFPAPGDVLGSEWLPGMLIAPPLDAPDLSPGARLLIRKLDLAAVRARLLAAVRRLKKPPGPTSGAPAATAAPRVTGR